EERSDGVELNGKTLTAVLEPPDGQHLLELFHRDKLALSIPFRVDVTPPHLTLEEVDAREDGTTAVRGRAEGAVALALDDKPLKMDRSGSFSFTVNRYEQPLVTLTAFDAVGNRSELTVQADPPPKVKGIHVSIYVAADRKLFPALVDLVKRTELNGMQIDIKDESGRVGYDSKVQLAEQVGSDMPKGGMNLGRVMDKCWYNDIYTIGRVVCFKDPIVARKRPDLAVHDKQGGLWGKGEWLDPYNREVWNYLLELSKEAASWGFKEIQFDYVRFPSDGDVTTCVFPSQDGRPKGQVILDFLQFMRENLKPLGVSLSADLFGLTASSQGEMGIGQDVTNIASYMDYLSPMVYPSHYNKGEYNISVPEADPYRTVFMSLEDFKRKMEGTNCRLRPWLQDFSLKIRYTPDMVRAQMQACYDAGVEEWLLWDPDCTFTEAALNPE
ncbi:MAG: putative glycoside hydrolase, partial [Syntrophales bacterium]|nr:putative glycoside hydrolase [Syntrophales bacterium]